MRRTILPLAVVSGCGQDYDVSGALEVDPADVTECAFVPIVGTQFQRYDCNPVFSSSDEAWVDGGVGAIGFHAEEVLGHPFYQMWYATDRVDGSYGLGYATSASGTLWTPLPANPVFRNPNAGFNRDGMGALSIVWDGDADQYVLSYQGINFDTNGNGLGFLTSPDGQVWTEENGGAPFIDLSAEIADVEYCWPLSLTWERGVGLRGYITGGPPRSSICQVYAYGGADLATMKPEGQVVLPAGPDPYDIEGIGSASVVKLNATYYMFYTGIAGWEPIPDTNFISPSETQLGIATSPDGVVWTKSPQNPIEQLSLVKPGRISNVAAQVVGPRIHLWITDTYEDLGASAVGYFLYEPDKPYHL